MAPHVMGLPLGFSVRCKKQGDPGPLNPNTLVLRLAMQLRMHISKKRQCSLPWPQETRLPQSLIPEPCTHACRIATRAARKQQGRQQRLPKLPGAGRSGPKCPSGAPRLCAQFGSPLQIKESS